MPLAVNLDKEALGWFCRANGIARLSVFGSALGHQFGPDSDVDLLVEFLPGRVSGLLGMARMERELSDLIGRQVDLRTPEDLSHFFRDRVLEEAEVQYVA